ncbi:uncharacterized protein LOC128306633 [Anopheles moucheti]|uniref:uncharacterized protein LOC128306633 n=1 Tax=Anopheles moucheti TaxID=186751 RepID=UPI0022F10C6E|nr:uncharacterized protein LOC128306633 [Anopheles moucheti]
MLEDYKCTRLNGVETRGIIKLLQHNKAKVLTTTERHYTEQQSKKGNAHCVTQQRSSFRLHVKADSTLWHGLIETLPSPPEKSHRSVISKSRPGMPGNNRRPACQSHPVQSRTVCGDDRAVAAGNV